MLGIIDCQNTLSPIFFKSGFGESAFFVQYLCKKSKNCNNSNRPLSFNQISFMSLKEKYIDKNRDIIQSCRKNNPKAQLEVYKLYYKAMYNTSLRITNNTADAEDIMQEAFLDAFRKIKSYSGDGSFGAWLKRIVINKSLDFVKARQSRMSLGQKIMELEEQKQDVESETADIEAKLLEVKSAMGKLPDNYRIILALFLIEGYDHQEIAQILKTPYGNVRTRYSRARQKLIDEIMKARNKN